MNHTSEAKGEDQEERRGVDMPHQHTLTLLPTHPHPAPLHTLTLLFSTPSPCSPPHPHPASLHTSTLLSYTLALLPFTP